MYVSKVTLSEISEKPCAFKLDGVGERKTTAGRKGLWNVTLIVISCSLTLHVLLLARVWLYLNFCNTVCP